MVSSLVQHPEGVDAEERGRPRINEPQSLYPRRNGSRNISGRCVVKMPPMMTCEVNVSGSRSPKEEEDEEGPSWKDEPRRLYHRQIQELADIKKTTTAVS